MDVLTASTNAYKSVVCNSTDDYFHNVWISQTSIIVDDPSYACVPTLQMDGAPSAVSIFKREIKPQIREVEDDISDGELSQRAEDMWLDLPSEQKVANTTALI